MARVVAVLVLVFAAGVAAAQSTETVGMITEIKTGHGRVELRSGSDWRRAGPLQALRAGDALRVTDDAVAVVMLSGGGTVKVQAANSPYAVAARADDTRTQKARTLVQAGLGFMAAGQREAPTAVLSTRSAASGLGAASRDTRCASWGRRGLSSSAAASPAGGSTIRRTRRRWRRARATSSR